MKKDSRISKELFRKFSTSVIVMQYFGIAHHCAYLLDRLCSSSKKQFRKSIKGWTYGLLKNRRELIVNSKNTLETLIQLKLNQCMKINFVKIRIVACRSQICKLANLLMLICSENLIKEHSEIFIKFYSSQTDTTEMAYEYFISQISSLISVISNKKVERFTITNNEKSIPVLKIPKCINFEESVFDLLVMQGGSQSISSINENAIEESVVTPILNIYAFILLSGFYKHYVQGVIKGSSRIPKVQSIITINECNRLLNEEEKKLTTKYLSTNGPTNPYSIAVYKHFSSILKEKVKIKNVWDQPNSYCNVYAKVSKFKLNLSVKKSNIILILSPENEIVIDYTRCFIENGVIKCKNFSINDFGVLDIQDSVDSPDLLESFESEFIEVLYEDIISLYVEIDDPQIKIEYADSVNEVKLEVKDHYEFLDKFLAPLPIKTNVSLMCNYIQKGFDLDTIKFLDYNINIVSIKFKCKQNQDHFSALEILASKYKRLNKLILEIESPKLKLNDKI